MTRRWPVIGLSLAVLWLFVRGVTLDPTQLLGEFLIGLGLGLIIAYFTRGFYSPNVALRRYIHTTPYVILYVLVFLKDMILANFDVAYRVILPSMPIKPAVVVFPLRVKSDLAITSIANSITLTPGTLTLDYDSDANELYIHAMVCHDPDRVRAPIRRWEDLALVIFNEGFESTETGSDSNE